MLASGDRGVFARRVVGRPRRGRGALGARDGRDGGARDGRGAPRWREDAACAERARPRPEGHAVDRRRDLRAPGPICAEAGADDPACAEPIALAEAMLRGHGRDAEALDALDGGRAS